MFKDKIEYDFKYYFRPNHELEGYDLIKKVEKIRMMIQKMIFG